jgi:Transglycosylase SLT domain
MALLPPMGLGLASGAIIACRALLIGLAGWLVLATGSARADDSDLCLDEIAKQEAKYGMPAGVLKAIARVESSGSPYGEITKPWPWTLNVGGAAHYYPTKAAALTALTGFRAQSDVNIDVGCMQISLQYHPNAFPDLATALDPVANVDYGALFLSALKEKSGDWMQAVGDYHSTTPGFGDTYRNLVQVALGGGRLSPQVVSSVRATAPDGPAIISISEVGGQTVITRLDKGYRPVAGTETTASGSGTACDHRQAAPSMSAGQGVRVWTGVCADDPTAGNRITIPDQP